MPRRRARPEPAVRAQLSPTKDVILYGPGRFILIERGRGPVYVSEREAEALVAAWLDFRPEAIESVLPPPEDETTSD